MQSLKREPVLWQFKAALQWLMSYLIQELTNWWPLLSFGLDRNLSEGNRLFVYVEKSQDDTCGGFQPSLGKPSHTNAKLSNMALLHLFSVYRSPPSGLGGIQYCI